MNTCFRSVFALDWNSNRNEEQKSCNWKKISSWREKKWKHKVFSLWSKIGSKPAYHQEYQPSSIQQRNFLHYSLIWRVYYFPNQHYSRLVKKRAYISVPIIPSKLLQSAIPPLAGPSIFKGIIGTEIHVRFGQARDIAWCDFIKTCKFESCSPF